MANGNNTRLKAWVRYDGTGRVVPGGPILQSNKPKVGNWIEIDAYECCNPSGSTTTTTTTIASNQFTQGYWLNSSDACTTTTAGSLIIYSSSSFLGEGVAVFTDSSLTTPVTEGYVISANMSTFLVNPGGVLSTLIC